jgi:hypothetical protein
VRVRDINQVLATLKICKDLLAVARAAKGDYEPIEKTYAIHGRSQKQEGLKSISEPVLASLEKVLFRVSLDEFRGQAAVRFVLGS